MQRVGGEGIHVEGRILIFVFHGIKILAIILMACWQAEYTELALIRPQDKGWRSLWKTEPEITICTLTL